MASPPPTPNQCDKCKKHYPNQTLTRCNTCFTKTCLRCQCELTGGLHSHIHDCFTFPNNPAVALKPLHHPSLAILSPRNGLVQPITRPFTALLEQRWLLDRPSEDTYRLLIDSFRIRLHDSFLFEGETKPGTIYSGCADSQSMFVQYLEVVRRRGLLPSWWTGEAFQQCCELGVMDGQFHSLREQLTQAMVVDYYQDATFPTQLRLFAEDVLGRGTCLKSCRGALDALVDMEDGEDAGTRRFDWNWYNTAFVNQQWERF